MVESASTRDHTERMLKGFGYVDALAGSPDRQAIFDYAGGGFRDFTRITEIDPAM